MEGQNIILYTTHCPKCEILSEMLTEANIPFEVCDNHEEVVKACEVMGEMYVPILKVGEEYMNFAKSIAWVGENA